MRIKHLLLALSVALAAISAKGATTTKAGDPSKPSHIVISKETMTLKLYDVDGKIIYDFPVAMGRNFGNKQRSGDMKTPEGKFVIQQIQPASSWSHDFKDGKGVIPHAYGDWFIRLLTPPHRGIGIHGTHDPSSIGKRVTEGCIRLHNHNLNKLKQLVKVGMPVTIESSKRDMAADGKVQEATSNVATTQNEPSHIVISKETMTLKLYGADGKIIFNFPVAVSKEFGNKQMPDDNRTPEGEFTIQQIESASSWSHNFNDGKGEIAHAYGDWFIHLLIPQIEGIGIHGTHDPAIIGTRATTGCIVMKNEDLNRLKPMIKESMKVIIEPSKEDIEANNQNKSEAKH